MWTAPRPGAVHIRVVVALLAIACGLGSCKAAPREVDVAASSSHDVDATISARDPAAAVLDPLQPPTIDELATPSTVPGDATAPTKRAGTAATTATARVGEPGVTTTTRRGSGTTTTRAPSDDSVTPTPTTPSTAEAAAALDQYLDGLEAENYASSMGVSADGPRLLAFVRNILKTINENAGASSTFTYTERRYQPDAVSGGRVTFAGRAVLRQTTTLKTGEQKSADVAIGEIAVVRRAGAWVVAEMIWDGSAVQYSPANDEQTVGDATLRLAGAVRFSNATVVIIAITSSKDVHIKIAKDRLVGNGFNNASRSRALVNSYAYFSYPRTTNAPRSWNGDVTVDSDPVQHTELSFS